jgi:phospholipid-binding lipoprotein MlaA
VTRIPRPAAPLARATGAAALLVLLAAAGGCAGTVAARGSPAPGFGAPAPAVEAVPAAPAVAAAPVAPAAPPPTGGAGRSADADPDDAPVRPGVDPLEPLNRRVHAFNEALDDAVFRPVAQFYDRWTPRVFRMILRNFTSNLLDPYIAFNSFLQGKPTDGFTGLGRFVFNTTFGFFGFGDPASEAGYVKHREDFGQTLGVWGVPPGPYLVLPLFGPSSVRDGLGFGVDAYLGLVNRFDNVAFRNSMAGVGFLDTRASLLPADRLLQDALDRYLLVRDGYLQRRRSQVYDGDPPDDD